jgi:hypothetical protein
MPSPTTIVVILLRERSYADPVRFGVDHGGWGIEVLLRSLMDVPVWAGFRVTVRTPAAVRFQSMSPSVPLAAST